jgi:hypothetical protein
LQRKQANLLMCPPRRINVLMEQPDGFSILDEMLVEA